MNKERLLIVGLQEEEVNLIRKAVFMPIIGSFMLPNIRLRDGILEVESNRVAGKFLKVDKVIYHGIYEDDFDFLTLLALWRGACLPNAQGMMDCRLRHPALVRALNVSKFGKMKRGMSIRKQRWKTHQDTVAKWGNWHCGENKHRFDNTWETNPPTVFEPFIKGQAVRIMLIGERYWQIRLTGDSWLKSIHHTAAAQMPVDNELLKDARALAAHFQLDMVGIDYMVGDDGERHLLEVNHIPNVTVFPFVHEAFLEYAIQWVKD